MHLSLSDSSAGPMFALVALASITQFILVILVIVAVLAPRRMAAGQEATARHLAQLLEVAARTNRSAAM